MKPIRIKNPRRRFTAARDENGVPHIAAATWRNALYGLGYLHAIDRPTQMLFAHAVASGRSAELIADKPELLETDRFFRRVGLFLHLEREVRRLDDVTFDHLTAYCEGVNDGMKEFGRSLPMWATGFQPQPWNQQAVLLIGNLLNFGGLAVGQQQNERILLELIQTGVDRDKLRELFEPLLDDADFDLLSKIKISNRLSDEALELITDLPRLAGSNAWAVAPAAQRHRRRLLASDPHLEVNRLPAIWYEAVLHWDGRLRAGRDAARLPAVCRGPHPEAGLGRDVSEGRHQRLLHRGLPPRRARLAISSRRAVERFSGPRGNHAPQGRPARAPAHLLQRPGHAGGGPRASWARATICRPPGSATSRARGHSIATWLRMIECDNTRDAMDLARECPQPTLCWVFADRRGTSACRPTAGFRRRPAGYSGLLPIPAWDAANHWRGWLPVESLPGEYDPPEGFVSRANEDINPPGGPVLVTLPVPDYRKRRIDERLAELPHATVDDMQALQYDVISLQARDLLAVFLPHLSDGELKERLTDLGLQLRSAQSRSHAFLAVVSQRAVGDLWPGDGRARGSAGGGCCTCARGSDSR